MPPQTKTVTFFSLKYMFYNISCVLFKYQFAYSLCPIEFSARMEMLIFLLCNMVPTSRMSVEPNFKFI